MTQHLDEGLDAALRRDLAARWCVLAEQRLQHLTLLFESGRWRRYYGDRAFLENIKEAKRAVEIWRILSRRPVARRDDAPDLSRLELEPEALWRPSAPPTEASFEDADLASEEEAPRELTVDLAALEQALIAPPPAADVALMEQRYPHLRNVLV